MNIDLKNSYARAFLSMTAAILFYCLTIALGIDFYDSRFKLAYNAFYIAVESVLWLYVAWQLRYKQGKHWVLRWLLASGILVSVISGVHILAKDTLAVVQGKSLPDRIGEIAKSIKIAPDTSLLIVQNCPPDSELGPCLYSIIKRTMILKGAIYRDEWLGPSEGKYPSDEAIQKALISLRAMR